jgi:hypothetical protein
MGRAASPDGPTEEYNFDDWSGTREGGQMEITEIEGRFIKAI